MCSMVTSLAPPAHGATRNGLRMRDGLASLPVVLAENGYAASAFVGAWPLKGAICGLAEHFDTYREVLSRRRWFGLFNREANASDLTDHALQWVGDQTAERDDQPFFLWVHYVEPHAPYRFHKEAGLRLGIKRRSADRSDRYDTEIAAVDSEIERLLEGIGEIRPASDLVVVLTADHGESLGEHGYWGHGRHLFEPSLRIPLSVTWGENIRPQTIAGPANLLDLAPTILDLLDLHVPDSFAGASWAPTLRFGAPDPISGPRCYQAHKGAVHSRRESTRARSVGLLEVGVVVGTHKEILRVRNGKLMRFDLITDPDEESAFGDSKEPTDYLLECYGEIRQELTEADALPTRVLDKESEERLRALGYFR